MWLRLAAGVGPPPLTLDEVAQRDLRVSAPDGAELLAGRGGQRCRASARHQAGAGGTTTIIVISAGSALSFA